MSQTPQSTHLANVSYWTMSKKTRCFVSHLSDPFLHEMMNGRELMVFVLAYAEWHWQKSLVIMIKTLSLFIRSHLLTFAIPLSYELPQRLLVRLGIVKSNPYKWRTSLLDKLKVSQIRILVIFISPSWSERVVWQPIR